MRGRPERGTLVPTELEERELAIEAKARELLAGLFTHPLRGGTAPRHGLLVEQPPGAGEDPFELPVAPARPEPSRLARAEGGLDVPERGHLPAPPGHVRGPPRGPEESTLRISVPGPSLHGRDEAVCRLAGEGDGRGGREPAGRTGEKSPPARLRRVVRSREDGGRAVRFGTAGPP